MTYQQHKEGMSDWILVGKSVWVAHFIMCYLSHVDVRPTQQQGDSFFHMFIEEYQS